VGHEDGFVAVTTLVIGTTDEGLEGYLAVKCVGGRITADDSEVAAEGAIGSWDWARYRGRAHLCVFWFGVRRLENVQRSMLKVGR